MRKVIIILAVVLVVFALSGAVVCEEPQDISWLDGTTWEKSENPFKGSKTKITVENGIGTGIDDILVNEARLRNIHVDEKGDIVLECLYTLRDGRNYWAKMKMKFKKEGKVMVIIPKEYGPFRSPLSSCEMKLVEE